MHRSRRRGGPGRRAAAAAMLSLLALIACYRGAPPEAPATIDLLTEPFAVAAEVRRYRFGADERDPLLSGWWSRNERDRRGRTFVWATAEESRFGLTIFRVEDKQALVTLRALPSKEPQRIDVAVNDQPLGTLHAETDDREFRLVLPAAALRLGDNVLSFRHAFVTPGPNPRDPRRLAAAYSSLLLGPECLALRAKGEPEPTHARRAHGKRSISLRGPAAVSWTIDVPKGATLTTKLAMPKRSPGPAEVALEVRSDADWSPLATTVVRLPWLASRSITRLSADLAALAGRRAELRLVARPLDCRSLATLVRVKRAALALRTGDRP